MRNAAITEATLQPFAGLRNSLESSNPSAASTNCAICTCTDALHWRAVEPLSGLEALVALNLEECLGLVGGLDLLSALPELSVVNACDTQLDAASFVAEQHRVLHFGLPQMMGTWRQRLLAGREGRGGVEVDLEKASNWTTPLVLATSQSFLKVVEVLLEYRADAKKEKYNGFTPLMVAAQQGSVQVAKLLLAKGADMAAKAGQTPLFLASRNGHDVVDTSRHRRRQEGGVAGLDRTIGCASFGPP